MLQFIAENFVLIIVIVSIVLFFIAQMHAKRNSPKIILSSSPFRLPNDDARKNMLNRIAPNQIVPNEILLPTPKDWRVSPYSFRNKDGIWIKGVKFIENYFDNGSWLVVDEKGKQIRKKPKHVNASPVFAFRPH